MFDCNQNYIQFSIGYYFCFSFVNNLFLFLHGIKYPYLMDLLGM